MNKKKVLIILSTILVIGIISFMPTNENNVTDVPNSIYNDITNNVDNNEKEEMIEYYADNKSINKFLNIFNKMYPDNQITSDMLKVYYHHGSYHKDQVQFYMNDLQITLSGGTYSDSASVYIDNNDYKNDEVVKQLVILFTKVFDQSLTTTEIEGFWNSQKQSSSSINKYNNIEYWSSKNIDTSNIIYIKISGTLN